MVADLHLSQAGLSPEPHYPLYIVTNYQELVEWRTVVVMIVDGAKLFSHLPFLLGVQFVHAFPFLAQTQLIQRPNPLHRQHCGMDWRL